MGVAMLIKILMKRIQLNNLRPFNHNTRVYRQYDQQYHLITNHHQHIINSVRYTIIIIHTHTLIDIIYIIHTHTHILYIIIQLHTHAHIYTHIYTHVQYTHIIVTHTYISCIFTIVIMYYNTHFILIYTHTHTSDTYTYTYTH